MDDQLHAKLREAYDAFVSAQEAVLGDKLKIELLQRQLESNRQYLIEAENLLKEAVADTLATP